MKERLTLHIAGHPLNLRSDQSPAYVEQLGEILNAKMNAASCGGRHGKLESALLVALDLLDEQVKGAKKRKELEQQLASINEMIRSGALRFVEEEPEASEQETELGEEAHEEA